MLTPAGKQEDMLLPPMKEQEPLDLLKLKPTQHFTEPPPRYNEASLVKTLEKEGIGRPSTYAAIISKIQDRGYVEQKERRFYATEIGMKVTDILVEHFPKVMDLKFTRHMEEELDQIETQEVRAQPGARRVLRAVHARPSRSPRRRCSPTPRSARECGRPLGGALQQVRQVLRLLAAIPECKYIKKTGDDGDEPRSRPRSTEHQVPRVRQADAASAWARAGRSWAARGYPECKTTMGYRRRGQAGADQQADRARLREVRQADGAARGPARPVPGVHAAIPSASNAKDVDAQGNPIKPIDTGIVCEKCGSPMVVQERSARPVPGLQRLSEMPQHQADAGRAEGEAQGHPAAAAAQEAGDAGARSTTRVRSAARAMKLRSGRGGTYFLGCSKYPKCRGTKEVSPELLDQIHAAMTGRGAASSRRVALACRRTGEPTL